MSLHVCLYSVAQSCLLVLSFFKAKRSQYYGKFEVNFSIYRPNEFSYSSEFKFYLFLY